MSKGKQRPASPPAPAENSSSPSDDDVVSPRPPSRRPLYAAAGLTLCWCAAIILLAWRTANPVTLNVLQLAEADFVVTATVSAEHPNSVAVQKEWKHAAKLETLTVENLAETHAQPGETYVMPLTKRLGGVFRVTLTRSSKQKRVSLVYPATSTALEQLQRWLDANAAN